MPEPLSLGNGIPDTNTVPGLKHRTFYAVEEGGQRVSIDATERRIIIERDAEQGSLRGTVGDTSGEISLTGSAATYLAKLRADGVDASLLLQGSTTGGVTRSIFIDSFAAEAQGMDGLKGRPLRIVEIRDCEPGDGNAVYKRLIVASDRYRVS